MELVYYIPIATALFCAFFFVELFQHWRNNPRALHLLWWTIGVFFYGAGPITEAFHSIAGYSPVNFKIWYILGAILGGAPLAQGTVYLLLKRRTANILSFCLIIIAVASIALIIFSPLKPVNDPAVKLSGTLFEWSAIRFITPFINMYAFTFLVGGAIYSAIQYSRKSLDRSRFWGNVLIAVGGLLPGIGGAASKAGGHIELLYLSALLGIAFIHAGYHTIRSSNVPSIYPSQVKQTKTHPYNF